jgi:uncharacterized protein (DUF2141 family)
MRHRPRAFAALTLAGGAALLGAGSPPPAEIDVTVTGLRSAEGVVMACMTPDPKRFPKCRGDASAYRRTAEASAGTVHIVFTGVTPGRYAIALLHDENANGRADRALGMMPVEGFGFSRDAAVRMGPPAFGDAVFEVSPGTVRQTIRMRYML